MPFGRLSFSSDIMRCWCKESDVIWYNLIYVIYQRRLRCNLIYSVYFLTPRRTVASILFLNLIYRAKESPLLGFIPYLGHHFIQSIRDFNRIARPTKKNKKNHQIISKEGREFFIIKKIMMKIENKNSKRQNYFLHSYPKARTTLACSSNGYIVSLPNDRYDHYFIFL